MHILQQARCSGSRAASGVGRNTDSATAAPRCSGNRNICPCFMKSSVRQVFRGKKGRKTCPLLEVCTCFWCSRCNSCISQTSTFHTRTHRHMRPFIFSIHAVCPTGTAQSVSDSPLKSPYFFWLSSCTSSSKVLLCYTKRTRAVGGNVPDHFKAGLLLLDGFVPFESQDRGRMNGKGPYSRKVNLGKQ